MKVFISYRHVEPDSRFLNRLQIHLASIADVVQVWADTGIPPGANWISEIERAIEMADVAIVLVSADFAASQFIHDVELPMLLDAQSKGRLRVVPMFIAPCGVLPPGLGELQGANSPDKTFVTMSRARQEATFANFVKWLSANVSMGQPEARACEETTIGMSLERAPAAGLLFDRAEIRAEIEGFLTNVEQRVCVIHGFPGVGKTTLAASLVAQHCGSFADVFWLTCRSTERTGLLLIARLDAFLQRNGNNALRGLVDMNAGLEFDVADAAISLGVQALAEQPYLLVFDEFQACLSETNELIDDITNRLLSGLIRAPGASKMLLLSDRRAVLEHRFDHFPTGVALEHQLLGLPDEAVEELIAECGVDIADAELKRRIATHFAGNPALIKIYCSFVVRQHRDPLDAMAAVSAQGGVAALIGEAVATLNNPSRQALERLAVLRIPLGWNEIENFGLDTNNVVSLLDSWLVGLDPASHTLALTPAIREFVLQTTASERSSAAHRAAAQGYAASRPPSAPRSYDELQPLLEEGYHRIEAGDIDIGAQKILGGVEFQIQWGYAELASHQIRMVQSRTNNPALVSRCLLLEGSIFDQRGLFDEAQRSYGSAIDLADSVRESQTIADALFLRGRIHNARIEFDAAQRDLARCVALCHEFKLGRPEARAKLALTWARKEKGTPDAEIVSAFEDVLSLAESQDDLPTVSDAHRQLGFIAWDRFRDRAKCEHHYDAALLIATENSLAQEIGAIHKELTYLANAWGDPEAAELHSRAAIDAAEALGDRYMLPGAYTNLALVLKSRGDLDGARDALERSAREFSVLKNRGGEAYALLELARIEETLGARDGALAHLELARTLCVDHGLTLQQREIERITQTILGTEAKPT